MTPLPVREKHSTPPGVPSGHDVSGERTSHCASNVWVPLLAPFATVPRAPVGDAAIAGAIAATIAATTATGSRPDRVRRTQRKHTNSVLVRIACLLLAPE